MTRWLLKHIRGVLLVYYILAFGTMMILVWHL